MSILTRVELVLTLPSWLAFSTRIAQRLCRPWQSSSPIHHTVDDPGQLSADAVEWHDAALRTA